MIGCEPWHRLGLRGHFLHLVAHCQTADWLSTVMAALWNIPLSTGNRISIMWAFLAAMDKDFSVACLLFCHSMSKRIRHWRGKEFFSSGSSSVVCSFRRSSLRHWGMRTHWSACILLDQQLLETVRHSVPSLWLWSVLWKGEAHLPSLQTLHLLPPNSYYESTHTFTCILCVDPGRKTKPGHWASSVCILLVQSSPSNTICLRFNG